MHNIPTALIRTFLTLARTNSTIKTAKIIGRSQPAISLQIQKLESLLNIKLFDRNLKSMQLTNDGHFLLPLANKMIDINDEIMDKLLENSPYKTVSIGIPNDISQYLWQHCISNFMQKNPNITLDITNDVSDNLINLHKKKVIDIIIIATTEPVNNTIYTTSRPTSIYSKRKKIFDEDVIKIITSPSGCAYREVITSTMQSLGKKYTFSVISKSVASTKSAVLNNDGVTLSLNGIRDFVFADEDIYVSEYTSKDVYISLLKNSEHNQLINSFISAITPFLNKI